METLALQHDVPQVRDMSMSISIQAGNHSADQGERPIFEQSKKQGPCKGYSLADFDGAAGAESETETGSRQRIARIRYRPCDCGCRTES
jgi:hypothetical protein